MQNKPRIFIGSSAESLPIASACNGCLDHATQVSMWPYIFDLGSSTLDSLITKANNVDFALFVFSPDDLTIMRETTKHTVRDNVLFELGLFIGKLSKERCFILKPRGVQLHLPTDLLGINTADFEPNRDDEDLFSAVNAACASIQAQIKKEVKSKPSQAKANVIPAGVSKSDFDVSDTQMKMLSKLLETHTSKLEGFSVWEIQNSFNLPDHLVSLSLIKLTRAGLIEQGNDSDFNGNEWYTYKITENGVEFILDNEDRLTKLLAPQPPQGYVPPQPQQAYAPKPPQPQQAYVPKPPQPQQAYVPKPPQPQQAYVPQGQKPK